MKDKTFEECVNTSCRTGDYWIAWDFGTERDNALKDILIDIRNSILLLAQVIQERPLK